MSESPLSTPVLILPLALIPLVMVLSILIPYCRGHLGRKLSTSVVVEPMYGTDPHSAIFLCHCCQHVPLWCQDHPQCLLWCWCYDFDIYLKGISTCSFVSDRMTSAIKFLERVSRQPSRLMESRDIHSTLAPPDDTSLGH